jgi:hypothetical protein
LFVTIYRSASGLYITGRSSLHFNETENVILPRDQINLSSMQRCPKVPRHHQITEPSQPKIRVFLALTAGALMCRTLR